MFWFILGLVVGAVVAWNYLPQPEWLAKWFKKN